LRRRWRRIRGPRAVIRVALLLVVGGIHTAAVLIPAGDGCRGAGAGVVIAWGTVEIVAKGGPGRRPACLVFIAAVMVAASAVIHPRYLWTLVAVDVALLLGWAWPSSSPTIWSGWSASLPASRPPFALAPLALAIGGALVVAGVVMFAAAHGRARGIETAGIVGILVGGLVMVVAFLLRAFSVFTTVIDDGGRAGRGGPCRRVRGDQRVRARVPEQGAGAERAPHRAGVRRRRLRGAGRHPARLAGMPDVVRMAPFVFSAGEVMIGRVGANLKGIDLRDGADELKRTLVQGDQSKTPARPASARAAGDAAQDQRRRRARRDRRRAARASCAQTSATACRSWCRSAPGATDAPVAYQFKVVGLFRMGFNEYDTRIAYVSIADAHAAGERAPPGVGRRAALRRSGAGAERGQEVQRRLGSPHHLVDWRELNQNLFRALASSRRCDRAHLVIIIVVAAFNIVSSLTMIVLSKTREVAILKSMGARRAWWRGCS
jgi:hypothetical protein